MPREPLVWTAIDEESLSPKLKKLLQACAKARLDLSEGVNEALHEAGILEEDESAYVTDKRGLSYAKKPAVQKAHKIQL